MENDKRTLLCGTLTASGECKQFCTDLYQLKLPLVQKIRQPVENPINDKSQIQRLSGTTDSSLFIHISHTKKRPNNVVFGRLFNYELTEQFEFQLDNYIGLQDIPTKKPMPQCKPMLVFQGDAFNNDRDMVMIKSLMMDIFKGKNYAKLNRNSLQWVISFTANHDGTQIKVRSYIINDFASTNFK